MAACVSCHTTECYECAYGYTLTNGECEYKQKGQISGTCTIANCQRCASSHGAEVCERCSTGY